MPSGVEYGLTVLSKVRMSVSTPGTTTAVRRAVTRSPKTSATRPRPLGSKARICRPAAPSDA